MEEVPGERPGTRRYFYAGYAYHLDGRVGAFGINNIYRCGSRTRSQCRGTVRVDGNVVQVLRPHDQHPPNPYIAMEARMRSDLLRMPRENLRCYKDIYREVALRYEAPVVMIVTLRSMRSSMERERAHVRPAIPCNIARLADLLRDYPLTHDVFRGVARGTDGLIALVFASLQIMPSEISEVREIFINSLFEVRPEGTRPFRILAIFIRTPDAPFPILYAAVERTSEALYIALWRFLFQLAPDLQNSLRTVVTDFERQMVASVRQELPRVTITGCWFFYRQALLTRWVGLELIGAPREVLWMSSALPLVPVVRFAEALSDIARVGDRAAYNHPDILLFLLYMRAQWLPLAEIAAVEQISLVMSVMYEDFYRYISVNLGGVYRNIWSWLETVVTTLAMHDMDWRGGRPILRRSIQLRAQESTCITRQQDNLSTGRITIEEFLLGVVDHRRRDDIALNIGTVAGRYYREIANEVATRDELVANDDTEGERVAFDADAPPVAPIENRAAIDEEDDLPDVTGILHPANAPDPVANEAIVISDASDTIPLFDNDEYLQLIDFIPNVLNGDRDVAENGNLIESAENNNNGNRIEIHGNNRNEDPNEALNDVDISRRNGGQRDDLIDAVYGNLPNTEGIENQNNSCNENGNEAPDEAPPNDMENNDEGETELTLGPCSVCLARRPHIVLNPCGHFGLCETCNTELQTRTCPICRAVIESTTKVFFA